MNTSTLSPVKAILPGAGYHLICTTEVPGSLESSTTHAMEIPGVGALVKVTNVKLNPNGSYALAEAVCFVPGVGIIESTDGSRRLGAVPMAVPAYATTKDLLESDLAGMLRQLNSSGPLAGPVSLEAPRVKSPEEVATISAGRPPESPTGADVEPEPDDKPAGDDGDKSPAGDSAPSTTSEQPPSSTSDA